MTDREKVKQMTKLLWDIITINEILLEIHDLPILRKMNDRIRRKMEQIWK